MQKISGDSKYFCNGFAYFSNQQRLHLVLRWSYEETFFFWRCTFLIHKVCTSLRFAHWLFQTLSINIDNVFLCLKNRNNITVLPFLQWNKYIPRVSACYILSNKWRAFFKFDLYFFLINQFETEFSFLLIFFSKAAKVYWDRSV